MPSEAGVNGAHINEWCTLLWRSGELIVRAVCNGEVEENLQHRPARSHHPHCCTTPDTQGCGRLAAEAPDRLGLYAGVQHSGALLGDQNNKLQLREASSLEDACALSAMCCDTIKVARLTLLLSKNSVCRFRMCPITLRRRWKV